MIKMPVLDGTFEAPSLIFTLAGNPRSITVLDELRELRYPAHLKVFESKDQVEYYFRNGSTLPSSALVLYDHANLGDKQFHPTCRNRAKSVNGPDWSMGAQWIWMVGVKCNSNARALNCAHQLAASFGKNFFSRLNDGQFPWGAGKQTSSGREQPPRPISVLSSIMETVAGLNAGPDLAAAIADQKFALELPKNSKISWIRVSDKPLEGQIDILQKTIASLQLFEEVCNRLAQKDEKVQQLLLAGVDLPKNSALAKTYLFPKVSRFSVSRPDLHFTGEDQFPFASEIDEMPGGMPELVHIDHVYGINQDRWKQAFDWLCEKGKLVFLVSHQWSKCYIPETAWLVKHLQGLGYPAEILTTDNVDQIDFCEDGLYLGEEKIGTIWRQFPIFETKNILERVVMVANEGKVRLFPEFSHFGNKSWFSIFRSHSAFYQQALDAETFAILDKVLPHSYIVGVDGVNSFPMSVNGININSIEDLKYLPQASRDHLVLKVCGANNLAARSYGVLMGVGIEEKTWKQWICDRQTFGQPFVVQQRLDAGIARIPIMNTKTLLPELFSCRILARPWSFNGSLISVHGCAVPSEYYRVHGMVAMAVVPFAI